MTLWYSDWNTAPIGLKVFPRDLAAAAVGTVLEPDADTACGRARDAESLTVVYRDPRRRTVGGRPGIDLV